VLQAVDNEIAREMRGRVDISDQIIKVQADHIESHKLQEKEEKEKSKRSELSLSFLSSF
jgi:hypothetical protein